MLTRLNLTVVLSLLFLLSAAPSAAQDREPELQAYTFVSQAGFAGAIWDNPAAGGFNRMTRLVGAITFDRPEAGDWEAGQYSVGLQSGAISFGYRHDEFSGMEGFAQGDAYTVAAGIGQGASAIGVSRTWRSVGPSDGSWEIGTIARSASGISAGFVWRDIGSPDVRGVRRRERLIGALTYRGQNSPFAVSLQADYEKDGGRFRALRIGGNYLLAGTVNALALAQWDGDGDFDGFRIGALIRLGKTLGLGGAGLSAGGDARTASAGLAHETPKVP